MRRSKHEDAEPMMASRFIRCDRAGCGDGLEVVYRWTTDSNGKAYIEQDVSLVGQHYKSHTYVAMEARHGPDERLWPDSISDMRQMVARADAKAARSITMRPEVGRNLTIDHAGSAEERAAPSLRPDAPRRTLSPPVAGLDADLLDMDF